jgi:CzcA family heavy metal efflux pump
MIRRSFNNPHLIVVLALVVTILAAFLIPRMPVDILPRFEKSAMQILTLYPGMPAEVVEKDITSRMERWTGQSPGIEKQISKSIMGVSIVTNFYGPDVDPAEAMANTSSYAMSDMYYQPPGTLPPMVQPFDPTASKPLMLLTVSSDTKSGKELYDLAYYSLRQMLSGVPGIVAPAAYGGTLRRIHIYVNPDRLEAYGISQTEVSDAIQKNTTMIPSGIAQIGDVNYGIDAKGMIIDVEDFNDIVVTHRQGKPVYISDLGRAADAAVIQTNIARVNGREQVYLPIFKRPGANTIESVEGVKAALPRLAERLPNDVNLDVIFDQSSYVRGAISGLSRAAMGGLLLVVIVLLLFLGNARSAAIAAVALPLSVLTAFLVLYFNGEAINAITLGGIALVLGLLVDNAIVVLENVDRHLTFGKPPKEAAYDAVREVATPVLASTLVIIVVFFPVAFLTGIAKFLFTPLAITVAGAMVGSYVFSLTLVPLAAAHFSAGRKANSTSLTRFQRAVERLKSSYLVRLERSLKRPGRAVLMAVILVGLAFLGAKNLGYELYPATDVGQMEIQVRTESGTPLRHTAAVIEQMEDIVREQLGDDLQQIISNIGVFYDLPAAYTPNSGTQDAFIGVQLAEDHRVGTVEYGRRLRAIFAERFPGVEISFDTGGLITAALNEGKPAPIDVQVIGNNLATLREIAERLRDTIRTVAAARDVRIIQRLDQPTKDVNIDRIRAAELGVEPVDAIRNIVSALNSSATYEKAFWIDERNGNHYYVGVTYPRHRIDDINVLGDVNVSSVLHDKAVPFRNFSDVSDSRNPVEINHFNLQRAFNVYATVDGADIGTVSAEIRALVDAMDFPAGYKVTFEGEVAQMERSLGDLGRGMLLAIVLAFLIIVPLFRSFRQPLIIILAFPIGLSGVVGALWISGIPMSIQAMMGTMMMVGISVSYGNLLVDRVNALVAEGLAQGPAIIQGAGDRFRPILMTAATTIFGLLPTALSRSAGTEANVPLALTVIGGTLAAVYITLFILPALYQLLAGTPSSTSSSTS